MWAWAAELSHSALVLGDSGPVVQARSLSRQPGVSVRIIPDSLGIFPRQQSGKQYYPGIGMLMEQEVNPREGQIQGSPSQN